MKKSILVFAVITLLIIISSDLLLSQVKTQELDPNILWVTDSNLGKFGQFAIHPNGHILAAQGDMVIELDGNTGKIIKTSPKFSEFGNIESIEVSNDGRYLAVSNSKVMVIDLQNNYQTMLITTKGTIVKFAPDSKRIAYRSYSTGSLDGSDSSIVIYYIEKKERKCIGTEGMVHEFTFSSNGKYIAFIERSKTSSTSNYTTSLQLWDALTLKQVKILGKYNGDLPSQSIKFSPNCNLVGFPIYPYSLYIYNTENYSLIKSYHESDFNGGVVHFCFINDEVIGVRFRHVTITNILNDKVIYQYDKEELLGNAGTMILNPNNNSLITEAYKLYAWDLTKIFTGIDDKNNNINVIINYNNNLLIISNLMNYQINLRIKILNLQGKIIRDISQTLNFNQDRLEIGIPLTAGVYIIQLSDGKKDYSTKIIVNN